MFFLHAKLSYFCSIYGHRRMDNLSYLTNAHASYIESLYKAYQEDPASVEVEWQKFFEGFDLGQREASGGQADAGAGIGETSEHFIKEIKVLDMINGFRSRGHLRSE